MRHRRSATVALVLLRKEYVTHGIKTVPDSVIVEIVDRCTYRGCAGAARQPPLTLVR